MARKEGAIFSSLTTINLIKSSQEVSCGKWKNSPGRDKP